MGSKAFRKRSFWQDGDDFEWHVNDDGWYRSYPFGRAKIVDLMDWGAEGYGVQVYGYEGKLWEMVGVTTPQAAMDMADERAETLGLFGDGSIMNASRKDFIAGYKAALKTAQQAWFVSYRDGDGPSSTNIVYADSEEEIDVEYGKHDWHSIRPADDYDIEEARAKGMPERTLTASSRGFAARRNVGRKAVRKRAASMRKMADDEWMDKWFTLRVGMNQDMQNVELQAKIDPFSKSVTLRILLDGRPWHTQNDDCFTYDEIYNALISFGEEKTIELLKWPGGRNSSRRRLMRKAAWNSVKELSSVAEDFIQHCDDIGNPVSNANDIYEFASYLEQNYK